MVHTDRLKCPECGKLLRPENKDNYYACVSEGSCSVITCYARTLSVGIGDPPKYADALVLDIMRETRFRKRDTSDRPKSVVLLEGKYYPWTNRGSSLEIPERVVRSLERKQMLRPTHW